MQEMPLISVIVPVYNTAPYLAECINSVLEQTYTNWELLLVDDGSTDASPQICDDFAKKDGRVRVFHQANQGVSAARNLALQKAEGEWLFFLDSDDWLAVNCLCYLFNMAKQTQCRLAICGRRDVAAKVEETGENPFSSPVETIEKAESLQLYCLGKLKYGVASKLYHKSLFDGRTFPTYLSISEDICLNYPIFCTIEQVAFGKHVMYFRRIREDSATNTLYTEKQMEELLKLAKQIHSDAEGTYQQAKSELLCLEMEIILDIFHNLCRFISSSKWEKEMEQWACALSKEICKYKFLPVKKRVKYRLFYISPALYKSVQRVRANSIK